MKVSVIVATDRNRLIGAQGRLPWHLPADLKHFKAITMGNPIVMGRRTYQSIGRPLPGRTNIVVTSDRTFMAPGCIVVGSLADALSAVADAREVMIVGGAMLYEQGLPLADRIYLTEVEGEFAGDTWFPRIDPRQWREIERIRHEADERNPHAYSFVTLDRVR